MSAQVAKSPGASLSWDIGVSAIVVRDDRVLLVRYAHGSRRGLWTVPGGYAEPQETLDAAALRELKEEVGLDGRACGIIAVRTRTDEQGGAVFVGFRVRCDQGNPIPDGWEVDAAQFFSRTELLALSPVLELSRQMALAALDMPGYELVEREIAGRSSATYKAYMPPGGSQ